MVIKLIALALGIIISIAYIVYSYKKFGLLKSVSISYYEISPRWIFQVFIYNIAFTLIYVGNTYLFYASGVCLALVGLMPSVKVKWMHLAHTVCAVASVVLAFLGLFDYGYWYFILPVVLIGLLLYWHIQEYWVYFFELLAFVIIYIGLFVHLI